MTTRPIVGAEPAMDVPVLFNFLGSLVLLGVAIYVLNRESRVDDRLGAGANVKVKQGASVLRRFGARFLDFLPFGIVYQALAVGFDFGLVLPVLYVVVLYAYFVLADAYAGTTLGKRLLSLRVVGPSGDKPEIKQAATREAVIIVSALLGAVPFAGDLLGSIPWLVIAWTIANSPTKQGQHDQIAGGTRVIKVS